MLCRRSAYEKYDMTEFQVHIYITWVGNPAKGETSRITALKGFFGLCLAGFMSKAELAEQLPP